MTTTKRSIWWTKRAAGLHLVLCVCLPGFVIAFLWQVERVRQGNTLSWAYVFEWPFFFAYAIYLWWRLVHDQPGRETPKRKRKEVDLERQRFEDEEMAAYNDYLARLDNEKNDNKR